MGDLSSAALPKHKSDYVVDIQYSAPVLHRVPTQVRGGSGGAKPNAPGPDPEAKSQMYDPVLVSLGPYHHGQPLLQQVEDLKHEILHLLTVSNKVLDEQKLLNDIRRQSHEIRSFYGDLSQDKLDDNALANMMLRDACFLIYCIANLTEHEHEHEHGHCLVLARLGMSRLAFLVRDFFMWENQLPFFLLKLLIPLICPDAVAHKSLEAFFYHLVTSLINCGDFCNQRRSKIPQAPITHLLGACRTILVENENENESAVERARAAAASSQFRSVRDLKAKGIHFRPNKSQAYCLTEIDFRSYSFYGMLRLPILSVDHKTKVMLSNMIAMEMSAGSRTRFEVTSYVKFIKSLIMKAEDVKELREKGIVVSCLTDDEDVVKMFRDLNTDGSCQKDLFRGVRDRINHHCRSNTKTFKAELLYTYFRSPWTAIALFAAILLLCINCLNFLLNYYKFTHLPNRTT